MVSSVRGEWTEADTGSLVLSNPSYVFASVVGSDSFPLATVSRQTESWFPGGPPINLPAGVAFLEAQARDLRETAPEQASARTGDQEYVNSPRGLLSRQSASAGGTRGNPRLGSGNWYPVIDLIRDGDCTENSFQRGVTFPTSPADVRLVYAKSGKAQCLAAEWSVQKNSSSWADEARHAVAVPAEGIKRRLFCYPHALAEPQGVPTRAKPLRKRAAFAQLVFQRCVGLAVSLGLADTIVASDGLPAVSALRRFAVLESYSCSGLKPWFFSPSAPGVVI